MPMVRVTLFPEPVDVPEDEIPVLRAQGLLIEDEGDSQDQDGEPAGKDAAKPSAAAATKPAPSGAE
jgi:hypothetical protein